ncbi:MULTISPECIES: RteC domain-containing protein [unclassified Flavobacterium]|jgi:hypothetical protein|uniref:RteC domain-containing protein n=1 Tax=unclassified Flavobacterium TaxID=196869 RepID=UPI0025BB612B|nr:MULTISPECIES: RteC domain-containing protein [unclassified Flavobacterium]
MIAFSSNLLCEFEIENNNVDFEYVDPLKTSENAFWMCFEFVEKLKQFLTINSFTDEEEEIQFFKHIKPKFTSNLIYYQGIHDIESRIPEGSIKKNIRYFQKHLKKLEQFLELNSEFLRYYRIGNTGLDKQYFVRNRFDIKNNPDMTFYDYDPVFTTSQGNKVATLLANKKLKAYIENKIKTLTSSLTNSANNHENSFNLVWTDTKTNAIEMIYGIHSSKSINNGKVTIKEIVRAFEFILKIELHDYSRIFRNIKIRENPTQYTDILRNGILDYKEVSENH